MRTKFQVERYTTEQELLFIERLEHTSDIYGLSESTLCLMLQTVPRTLRKWKELYSNNKYSNVTPQGKIVCSKGLYKLIRPNSQYADKYVRKAKFDMICAMLDYRNTLRTVGSIQADGQLQLDLTRMSDTELINLANEYMEVE